MNIKNRDDTIFKLLSHENHLRYGAEIIFFYTIKGKPNLRWVPWNFYVNWFI